jgi:hypothetical protein
MVLSRGGNVLLDLLTWGAAVAEEAAKAAATRKAMEEKARMVVGWLLVGLLLLLLLLLLAVCACVCGCMYVCVSAQKQKTYCCQCCCMCIVTEFHLRISADRNMGST